MIDFHFKTDFELDNKVKYADWIARVIETEQYRLVSLDYIFCDDDYLLTINQDYLSHDTLTDIITFDYTEGRDIKGDIFISVERVRDNAVLFNVDWKKELLRVMAHGVLHLMGYMDKMEKDIKVMRFKEEEKIEMFHVEH